MADTDGVLVCDGRVSFVTAYTKDERIYDLHSAILHHGSSPDSGHYTM